ncbi:aminoacyl-tRNA hydrolase [Patescibacteria group bacterium]
MLYTIVGLGNPGEEYKNTRHNTGRIVLDYFHKKNNFYDWEYSKNADALYSNSKIGKNKIELIAPETFMNNSGKSVLYVKNKHKIKPENIIVIYDDLDLPLGIFKIAFNRGSGGHNGIESVVKKVKTKAFIRVRVGVSPVTPTGKLKKPKGEEKVITLR